MPRDLIRSWSVNVSVECVLALTIILLQEIKEPAQRQRENPTDVIRRWDLQLHARDSPKDAGK